MSTSTSRSKTKQAPSQQAPNEQAIQDAMKPGPENARLVKAAGSWKVAVTCWMKEGEEPQKSAGTSTFIPVFDGRYVREEFSGDFDGKPFRGVGTSGFDRAAKRYVSTWFDSMGTGIVRTSGPAVPEGTDIELTGEMTCPINGSTTLRQVRTDESADRFTVTMYNTVKGKEAKSMELVYTREK